MQQYNEVKDKQLNGLVQHSFNLLCQNHVIAFLAIYQYLLIARYSSMNAVDSDNSLSRRPRNGPSTPVKRGKGRNLKPYPEISVESPYFSPSKERLKGKNSLFASVEWRLQLTTTKTDQTLTDPSPSKSNGPFEAVQTRIPASSGSVSGLYRQLALCKPCLIQGVLFLS